MLVQEQGPCVWGVRSVRELGFFGLNGLASLLFKSLGLSDPDFLRDCASRLGAGFRLTARLYNNLYLYNIDVGQQPQSPISQGNQRLNFQVTTK